jgi:UDP-N-acetylmuramoyl-tripeptide--D-alanyl-D-alanine ligase
MVELGSMQDEANREFAAAVQTAGATLVAVGWTNRRTLLAGAVDPARVVCVRDRTAARGWVRANLEAGDAVLWENDLPDHYP